MKQPTEHLEAILQHAYRIYFRDMIGMNLAVVTRGGTAVVFDSASASAHIVPFELMRVDEKTKAAFAKWQATGKSRYFVIQFPATLRPLDSPQ